MKMKILALIPARSGSKSIIDKNILDFNGIPLIAHSINHAKESKYINRIIVSTDSHKYAEIVKKFDAEVPFLRPEEISGDKSLDIETFKHALKYLSEVEDYIPDIVVHLRPTHPIRNPQDIDKMIDLLINDSEADSIRSVIKSKETPFKMWFKENDVIKPIIESKNELYNCPRQELKEAYYQNANIDVIKSDTILYKNSMTGDKILGYVTSEKYDIDYISDFIEYEKVARIKSNPLRYVFDIDGIITIFNSKLDYQNSKPNFNNIQIINKLFEDGNEIILFTARGYKTGIDWREVTKNQLAKWNVKYHELIFGKPDADFYIDDKLISIDNLKIVLK
jgi:CMP-N,N'-diacetyllegionaminic acid synthase